MLTNLFIKNKKLNTSILIKKNYISTFVKKIAKENEKVFCIIDSKIKKKFNFKKEKNIKIITIECGEKIKTINGYKNLAEKLIKNNVNRKSVLVAIGGGTLGDLAGFVSSTVLRGLDFFLIPTTLLSQVDSSIGGKNGINTKHGKNLIGSFFHPSEVVIDISFLKSLPLKEIKSGYAEIVKHSLINDRNFFNWLNKNYKRIFNLETKIIEKAIVKSISIKLNYVNKDPEENLDINKEDLYPDYAGIRPKSFGEGEESIDFLIENENDTMRI